MRNWVDDDLMIRMDARDILEQAGFRVLDVEHGDAGPHISILVAKPFSAELAHTHLQSLLPNGRKPEPLRQAVQWQAGSIGAA